MPFPPAIAPCSLQQNSGRNHLCCFALYSFYPLISIHSHQPLFPLCCETAIVKVAYELHVAKTMIKISPISLTLQAHLPGWTHSFSGGVLLPWPLGQRCWLFFCFLSTFPLSPEGSSSFFRSSLSILTGKSIYPRMALKCMPAESDPPLRWIPSLTPRTKTNGAL